MKIIPRKKEVSPYKPPNQLSPFKKAIDDNDITQVQALIDQGVDVNGNIYDDTVFMYAYYKGYKDIAKLFLNADDFDVNDNDVWGHSHLTNVCSHESENHESDIEFIKLLLDNKDIDVNYTGWHNNTALHAARISGRSEVVKLLLEKGASIYVKTMRGTALHEACIKGHVDIIKLLLEHTNEVHRINFITEINADEKSALDIAKENKCTEIIEILKYFLGK